MPRKKKKKEEEGYFHRYLHYHFHQLEWKMREILHDPIVFQTRFLLVRVQSATVRLRSLRLPKVCMITPCFVAEGLHPIGFLVAVWLLIL